MHGYQIEKTSMEQHQAQPYQPRLEALRGYAALMVAYAHTIGAANIANPFSAYIKEWFSVIGNGGVGVTIFFVLSGHVLAMSLGKNNTPFLSLWSQFTVRRFFRIFPAMFVCLLFCYLWLNHVHVQQKFDAASKEYYVYWTGAVSLIDFFKDLIFVDNKLNPVTWTLQVEMLASMAFIPLWVICKINRILSIAILLTWACYFWLAPLYSYARTGFIFMFILGMQIKPTVEWLRTRCHVEILPAIALIAFLLCCMTNKFVPETLAEAWILEAIFAYFLIVALSASKEIPRVAIMDHKVPVFLGKISYSFYLWHFPVLYIIGTWLFIVVPNNWIIQAPNIFHQILFLLSTVVVIPLAWFSHRYVESPFIAWAKVLTNPALKRKPTAS